MGIDIDASGAAGQADGTAIFTSTVGVAPLQATISPVSGLGHAWLGVDYAYGPDGKPLAPTTDVSVGSLAAKLGVVGPDVSPTYAISFPKIGSQCNIGLRLTPTAAALNIDSIALTLLGGLLGPEKGDPKAVFDFYDELKKIPALNDAANQLMQPATTPWQKTVKYASIASDFRNINPKDLDTLAVYISGKTGKVVTATALKKALSAIGAIQGIFQIEQIVADEISFTISTGGADAEVTFTGSAVGHPEEVR